MRFVATRLAGVTLIEPEPHLDHRGMFARVYCPQEFAAAGLDWFRPRQINLSHNTARHTLRGLHYQAAPHTEAKLVRAVRGRAWDVVVDLRPESASYMQWTGTQLDPSAMTALLIPEGCAHGFLTLEADTDILYQMGSDHVPGYDRGLRWNDPKLGIRWPATPAIIDPRDAAWPLINRR